jgi:hypothetical protein
VRPSDRREAASSSSRLCCIASFSSKYGCTQTSWAFPFCVTSVSLTDIGVAAWVTGVVLSTRLGPTVIARFGPTNGTRLPRASSRTAASGGRRGSSIDCGLGPPFRFHVSSLVSTGPGSWAWSGGGLSRDGGAEARHLCPAGPRRAGAGPCASQNWAKPAAVRWLGCPLALGPACRGRVRGQRRARATSGWPAPRFWEGYREFHRQLPCRHGRRPGGPSGGRTLRVAATWACSAP